MNENRFASSFLIPGGIWLVLLFVVPLGFMFALSFGYTDDLGEAIYGFSLDNYRRVFDPDFIPVLVRSVGFALAAVALCLLIGYPVAYYIAVFGGRWKNVLLALVVLPFFVNYLVRTYAWIAMLGDDGLVNGILGSDIRFLSTPWAVIGGLVYGFLAFMILPIYASLDRMDPSLIEAARTCTAAVADVPQRHPAAHACRASSPARCWCSCPPWATSSGVAARRT